MPSRRIPWLNYSLLAANTLAFIFLSGQTQAVRSWLLHSLGMIPARYSTPGWLGGRALLNLGYLPFVTSNFLHGSFFHLLSNMWVLWLFGDNVEDRLGPVRFLLLYLSAGVAANLLHYYTNLRSDLPTIGASGAIAGVMGAYFLLYPRARIITLVPVFFYPLIVEIPAFFYLLVWFLSQVLYALYPTAAGGGVAWWAHVGGFLAGLVALVVLKGTFHRRRCYDDEYRPW